MNTGILGGTFDPIHSGHIAIARAVLAALGLDRVLLLPSGQPPYKRIHAGREDRLEMARLAAAGCEGIEVCDLEVRRAGESYTVDTMRMLRERCADDAFTYLIGADALDHLEDWRGIGEIAGQTRFAVIDRQGRDAASTRACAQALAERLNARIEVPGIAGPAISSGVVRERVATGESIETLVPAEVARYIREHGLYLCEYSEAEILDKLRAAITLHRYHHTLGVADTATRLAPKYGVDPMRARLAGLLHDCAKSLPYGEMRRLVEANVPDTDEQELDSEPVLHAPAGMVLARRDYGVRDPAILQAIRRHTLGGDAMTAMDAVIYVSDFIEPGRRPFEGLERARAAAETDIFEAMRVCARLTTGYLAAHGQTAHPRTLNLLNEHTEK